ncbi:MAG: alternative ribosome rescue aminoacyl-tRNA hydrolase ArfB [Acidobacteriota bacterium]|nr:alternative ribosome rescue aminoacyl-tRNA hydrolase ArfB [Acidobacteriota bacterium]
MIDVGYGVTIDPEDLEFSYSRSSGPGGQHVNKVESRVTLRFDVEASQALTPTQKRRIFRELETRISRAGLLILHCQAHRSRSRNQAILLERFSDLLAAALRPPKRRVKTRPGRAARERRITAKKRKSDVKRTRRKPGLND